MILDLRARGRTTVLTTHYMDEAERLCDRVAIVDKGKVIAVGSPADLIARTGAEHVVEFAVAGGKDGRQPFAPEAMAELDSVLAARSEGDGFALTVAEPHQAIPSLLELPRRCRPTPGAVDDPAGQPRRRLRRHDRPPPSRGRDRGSRRRPPQKRGRRRRRG